MRMKRQWMAMIIGMALVWPAAAQFGPSSTLPDPVRFAVRMEAGDVDQARVWLDAGLDPDFLGSRIGSGLMIGAWEGNIELMRLFLSRGADILQETKDAAIRKFHEKQRGKPPGGDPNTPTDEDA